MQPEHCPFHRRPDMCVPTARLLAQAGIIDPATRTPVAPGTTMEVASVPPREVTLVLVAQRLNNWGRVVIDPTLPFTEVSALDERSLRYSLQALWETVSDGNCKRIATLDNNAPQWWTVESALQEAQQAARRTTTGRDPGEADLWWYIAWLHLNRAHALWKEHIGHTLPQ